MTSPNGSASPRRRVGPYPSRMDCADCRGTVRPQTATSTTNCAGSPAIRRRRLFHLALARQCFGQTRQFVDQNALCYVTDFSAGLYIVEYKG